MEAVVYWTPGYFEKEYTKYNVLDSLPSMTMDDLLHVTDEMMDYLRGGREDLHVTNHHGRGTGGNSSMNVKLPIWKTCRSFS